MDLLAGGPRERQAQAPEHGLGRGGRSIAGGEDVVAQGRHCEGPGACRWPCPERSPGGARVRGAGQLVEVPCTWEGQGEGEVSRLGGGNAGTRGRPQERGRDEKAPLATPASSAGGGAARSAWYVGSQGSWYSGGALWVP